MDASLHSDAGSPSEGEQRISFDINDTREGTYTDHVAELFGSRQRRYCGRISTQNIRTRNIRSLESQLHAWTNLQAHSSLDHAEEVKAADENVAYANVIGKIKDLIWAVYDISGGETPEKRDEKRAKLRDGGLERRIEQIDEIVYPDKQ